LHSEGLIQALGVSNHSPRNRRTARTYAITDAGRARVYELMLDIVSSIGEYQRLFHLKVPHLEFLTRDEQLQLLEHYRDYCRTAIRHQERVTRELEGRLEEKTLQPSADAAQGTTDGRQHGLHMSRH